MPEDKNSIGCMGFVAVLLGIGIALWLIKIAAAVLIGFIIFMIFGVNWLIASVCCFLVIGFIFATLDLFGVGEKKKFAGGPCPYCGRKLRTPKAKQCPHCLRAWHGKKQDQLES